MGTKGTTKCQVCNFEVEVTEIINGANFDEHYLSCGHIQNMSKLTEQDYNLSRNKKELDAHVSNAHSPK